MSAGRETADLSKGRQMGNEEIARLKQENQELKQENRKLRQENHVLEQELERCREVVRTISARSEIDYLTGVYNRDGITRRVQELMTETRRGRAALCFLDIDHFKQINDRYGHGQGDHVLRLIARGIQEAVCEGDMVGRYGGDEFLILMYELRDEKDLQGRARRICSRVHLLGMQDGLSASIGISWYRPGEDSEEELLKRADDALYYCKQNGKNQIYIWP